VLLYFMPEKGDGLEGIGSDRVGTFWVALSFVSEA